MKIKITKSQLRELIRESIKNDVNINEFMGFGKKKSTPQPKNDRVGKDRRQDSAWDKAPKNPEGTPERRKSDAQLRFDGGGAENLKFYKDQRKNDGANALPRRSTDKDDIKQ